LQPECRLYIILHSSTNKLGALLASTS